jgi:probable HAF family extracellular repeat protein
MRPWLRIGKFLAASILLFALSATRASADSFTLTDLGTLPGYSGSFALGINSSGQVTGFVRTANGGADQAYLYSGGVMTGLGTLGGTQSQGYGINDSGQVVGQSALANHQLRCLSL